MIGTGEEFRFIAGVTKHVVARAAQQTADTAGFVIVIDREPTSFAGSTSAYGATTVLGEVQPVIVVRCDSVHFGYPCTMRFRGRVRLHGVGTAIAILLIAVSRSLVLTATVTRLVKPCAHDARIALRRSATSWR